MSHKTGKRVLATTATSALAFAGLIAMPLAAHAAGTATITNACGGATAAAAGGLDYLTFPVNSGTYSVFDGAVSVAVATAGQSVNATPAGGDVALSADGTTVNYYLPTAAYTATADAQGVKHLLNSFAVYDPANQPMTLSGTADDKACGVTGFVMPTQNATTGAITVTKGAGIEWSVTVANASSNGDTTVTTDGPGFVTAADKTLTSPVTTADALSWLPGAQAGSTQVLSVAGAGNVNVAWTLLPGYIGPESDKDFIKDTKAQVNWVPPVVNDRDGSQSDTVTLTNLKGVTYYYKVYTGGNRTVNLASATTGTGAAINDGSGDAANDVSRADTTWIQVPTATGSTLTITRPSTMKEDDALGIVAFPDDKTKFDAGNTITHEEAQVQFTDTVKIRALPAPTMVNGPGSADYYIVPDVEGVIWEITSTRADGTAGPSATYNPNDSRRGQQIPVYTGNPPETYKFTATLADGYAFDSAVTRTSWTQVYDSRNTITPEAPQFVDQTGIASDAVTFPGLSTGLDGYQVAITRGTTQPVTGDWKYADYSWYGKTVSLLDIQKALGKTDIVNDTHVWIKTDANNTTFVLAEDAEGNPVKHDWNYNFTNAVNIIPEPPLQTRTGDQSYTLTFPTDARVTYSVTDANGVTRTIPYGDLGKPLNYSGTVTVSAKSASGVYVIQPNADGTAPKPWVFNPITAQVTPGTPHSHDQAGTDQDTYEIPAQAGVLWTVDGVNADPTTYGQRISTGGKTEITFVARPAQGYSFVDGATTSFTLHWGDQHTLGTPEVDHTVRASGWQADVEWSAPEDAEGDVTYDVSFAKVTEDEDGDEVVGARTTWFEGTDLTSARINAGFNTVYRVYVTAIDENGVESEEGETTIHFATDNSGAESRWTDINRNTVTPSGVGALGWYQAGSSLYFNNTAFVTYRDQSNITFTVNGGQQLRVYGTQYTKGGRALIQVNGTNWAWLDAGASSNADPYKKMLRQINLPNTGTHTIKIIASLLPGKELALDAYEVVK